jgi:hypothetical protein
VAESPIVTAVPVVLAIRRIVDCARCGGEHEGIKAEILSRPITPPGTEQIWTHWAPCPANGQPILVRVTAGES